MFAVFSRKNIQDIDKQFFSAKNIGTKEFERSSRKAARLAMVSLKSLSSWKNRLPLPDLSHLILKIILPIGRYEVDQKDTSSFQDLICMFTMATTLMVLIFGWEILVLNENFFHQKLIVGTGLCGMDAETAHYYHVLLSYVYLVNAAVQRGHMNLTLVTGYWT